jgi:hypothetical protein
MRVLYALVPDESFWIFLSLPTHLFSARDFLNEARQWSRCRQCAKRRSLEFRKRIALAFYRQEGLDGYKTAAVPPSRVPNVNLTHVHVLLDVFLS